MSLSLTFRIDSSEFEIPVRYLNWVDRLGDELAKEKGLVFGVEDVSEWDPDVPHAVAGRMEMLAAIERLIHIVLTDHDLIPSRYAFDFEIFPGVPVRDDEVRSIVLPSLEGFYLLSGGE